MADEKSVDSWIQQTFQQTGWWNTLLLEYLPPLEYHHGGCCGGCFRRCCCCDFFRLNDHRRLCYHRAKLIAVWLLDVNFKLSLFEYDVLLHGEMKSKELLIIDVDVDLIRWATSSWLAFQLFHIRTGISSITFIRILFFFFNFTLFKVNIPNVSAKQKILIDLLAR